MSTEHADSAIRKVLAVSLLMGVLIASGCGEETYDEERATQVAVIVNGREITIHQINQVLEKTPDVNTATIEEAKRNILDKLIDRELAAQRAVENKLDRTPQVMQSIEEAKSDILARAYLEGIAGNVPKVQDWDMADRQEISKYYAEHPELFTQRRIFTLEEIVISGEGIERAQLRQQIASGRNINEIAEWLNAKGIKFSANRIVRPAEQISLRFLPRLQVMNPGEIEIFELGDGRVQVIRVVSFKQAPVDEDSASPRIAQFLFNRRSSEAIAEEMKRLREVAVIEYLGDFAEEDKVGESGVAPSAGIRDFAEERASESLGVQQRSQ